MPAVLLVLLYLAVTLLPLGLAWLGARPPRGLWDEMASGAGMLAFTIMLVEFVLSGRFRTVSRRIGMDVTMRFHQLLARTALVLALVHPFLYRTPFDAPLPWDTTRSLTLTDDPGALATGVLAWMLLGALVLLSIFRTQLSYTYETWRWLHGLGAALIAGLSLHHALNAGRYSQDPMLAAVWVGLAALAAWSLVVVYIVAPLRQWRRPWRVRSVRPVALKMWELTLEPDGHDGLAYEAGQFVWLNVGHSAFSQRENPFSISSAPADGPALQFVIKELGDFTRAVGGIAPGTRAYVDGPHGNLTVPPDRFDGIALVAGGVGVAPLLGILRQLRHREDAPPVVLIYGNRVEEQIVHADELDELARQGALRLVHVLSEPPDGWTGKTGMVDARLLRETLDTADPARWLFVLCGPPPMMRVVEHGLIGMGVPAQRILSETFTYD